MTSNETIREAEYRALMDQYRDHERTAQWSWTAAALGAAFLLTSAISARHPGLLIPVEVCIAAGFYAQVNGRRRMQLVASYVQHYFEQDRDGAGWHARLAQLQSQPGGPRTYDWAPLALANALMLTSVVFGWLFADGVAHGELMAGFVTSLGMAFSVHSMSENMRLAPTVTPAVWSRTEGSLREVTPITRSGTR